MNLVTFLCVNIIKCISTKVDIEKVVLMYITFILVHRSGIYWRGNKIKCCIQLYLICTVLFCWGWMFKVVCNWQHLLTIVCCHTSSDFTRVNFLAIQCQISEEFPHMNFLPNNFTNNELNIHFNTFRVISGWYYMYIV